VNRTAKQLLARQRRFAIEFHHGSWCKETTLQLLETYQGAWVVVEASFLPRLPHVSGDFAYVRWHGHPGIRQRSQRQLDPGAALRPWVHILRQLGLNIAKVSYGATKTCCRVHAGWCCASGDDVPAPPSTGEHLWQESLWGLTPQYSTGMVRPLHSPTSALLDHSSLLHDAALLQQRL
jgi:hypothetical protein